MQIIPFPKKTITTCRICGTRLQLKHPSQTACLRCLAWHELITATLAARDALKELEG